MGGAPPQGGRSLSASRASRARARWKVGPVRWRGARVAPPHRVARQRRLPLFGGARHERFANGVQRRARVDTNTKAALPTCAARAVSARLGSLGRAPPRRRPGRRGCCPGEVDSVFAELDSLRSQYGVRLNARRLARLDGEARAQAASVGRRRGGGASRNSHREHGVSPPIRVRRARHCRHLRSFPVCVASRGARLLVPRHESPHRGAGGPCDERVCRRA